MGKGSSPRNCFSDQFKSNYDDIFLKLTGQQWAAKLNITIESLDNWNCDDFKVEKIGRQEFMIRIVHSTISAPAGIMRELTIE